MTVVLVTTAAVAVGTFFLLWLVSLGVRDASIVDPFWGPSFAVVSWVAYLRADHPGSRGLLLAVLVSVWAIRLGVHLATRNLGHGEDRRYQAMRGRWGRRFGIVSLGTVFLAQAGLMWVVSLPLQMGMVDGGQPGMLAWVGVAVWALGLFFEATGDLQLRRFTADRANAGKVMDRGLWRYTRHPNYLGDFTVWWGLFLVSVAHPRSLWTAVGPAVMSILLLRVSGVTLLERDMVARRPGYAEYAARTSAFFPRAPRS